MSTSKTVEALYNLFQDLLSREHPSLMEYHIKWKQDEDLFSRDFCVGDISLFYKPTKKIGEVYW